VYHLPHIIILYAGILCLGYSASPDSQLNRILQADNKAMTQIARWIHEDIDRIRNNETERHTLALRIHNRLEIIRKQYLRFLKQHPEHAKARIAYASFLTNIDNRQGATEQWKQALTEEPKNAAALNNLAIHLGTIALETNNTDGIEQAFKAMSKAVALAPKQPLYHHNYATLLCSFTVPATKFYQIRSNQVIRKAINEYDLALKLKPDNFEFAADRAEAYLDLRPFRYQETLKAWSIALRIASTQDERDWAYLQTAIAHYKANQWNNVSRDLDKMSGENHKPLLDQLRNAAAAKIKTDDVKP